MAKLPEFPVYLNAFEIGILQMMIWQREDIRQRLKGVFEQLVKYQIQFKAEAGVRIKEEGNFIIEVDKAGNRIIREKYGWEKGEKL